MNEISLVQKRIGSFLCDDLARGKECPNCAQKAERLYAVVVKAEAEERETNAVKALERIAGFVEALDFASVAVPFPPILKART